MTASLDPDNFGVVRGTTKPIPYDIPTFETLEEERQHRKERLAAAFRLFGKFGFGEGVAGHITVRDPEHLDCFWLNPIGIDFRLMRVSDLILVNHYGEILEGDYAINQAAFAIHSQVHAARPHPFDLRESVLVSRPTSRSDYPGRVRVLRRPCALR